MKHWHYLLIIMVLSGGLGGVVNYLLEANRESQETKKYEIIKSIIIGISAAFLVPLFLNTISSNIIAESKNDVYKLFVIAGFCLLVSISSKPFIRTLSNKIMKEIDDVKNEVSDVKKDVETIIENETEQDLHDEDIIEDVSDKVNLEEKDVNRIKILKALTSNQYTYRSLSGISKDIELDIDEVNITLGELFTKGFVNQQPREKGLRFYITKEGREYLDWYNKTSYAYLLEKQQGKGNPSNS
ncbi:YEATS-associated helix-containing protein [Paenibacillus brasilensis]|uniref:YEATS-Like-Associating Three TM domain-containing protein n=1 Tax=Paenibacillus brasilensis TaxID=128574 RepID=A0ABU0L459_9BACL|nr:YEATS-associated helix-containing protein [Paenibacillus brasilensis]MDQ0496065.1 hypothetical protein [Paenibacillus brasilensis]